MVPPSPYGQNQRMIQQRAPVCFSIIAQNRIVFDRFRFLDAITVHAHSSTRTSAAECSSISSTQLERNPRCTRVSEWATATRTTLYGSYARQPAHDDADESKTYDASVERRDVPNEFGPSWWLQSSDTKYGDAKSALSDAEYGCGRSRRFDAWIYAPASKLQSRSATNAGAFLPGKDIFLVIYSF